MIAGLTMLVTPWLAPCSTTKPTRRTGIAADPMSSTVAVAMPAKQASMIAVMEMRRCASIIAMRPATCIGPIIDAVSTAVASLKPRSLKSGRMWLRITPWLRMSRVKPMASSQKAGLRRCAFRAGTVSSGAGGGAGGRSFLSARVAIHISGAARRSIDPP